MHEGEEKDARIENLKGRFCTANSDVYRLYMY